MSGTPATIPESAYPTDDRIMRAPEQVSAEHAPWPLLEDRVQRKTILKTMEELNEAIGELSALGKTLARISMQGLDEFDPTSGVHNRDQLQKEIGDVKGNLKLLIENLELDKDYIKARAENKYLFLRPLHART